MRLRGRNEGQGRREEMMEKKRRELRWHWGGRRELVKKKKEDEGKVLRAMDTKGKQGKARGRE